MTGQNLPTRLRGPRGRLVTVAVLGCAAALSLVGVEAAGGAASSPSTRHRTASQHVEGQSGLSARVVACERRGGVVCDPGAYKRDRVHFPLSGPDPHVAARHADGAVGGALLTEQQALSQIGWSVSTVDGSQATVSASMMTYGQAQAAYPYLAALSSAVVDPSRDVWVITRYYSPSITEATGGGYGDPVVTEPTTTQDPYDSVVIDAATGEETDSCQHCAAIPEAG